MKSLSLKLFIIALIICLVGVVSIYSSTFQKEGSAWQDIFKRQLLWLFIGIVLFFLASNLNYRRLWDATYILYGAALFLLLLVFILGIVRLGAQRWLRIAWFNFQPSEIVKLIMVIFFARYFSKKASGDASFAASRYGITQALIIPFLFLIIPMGLIIEQPDLGSGILVFLIFIAMLFFSAAKLRYILLLLIVSLSSLPVFWHFLKDYQRERLMVFLNPNMDPLGAGYTIIQSRIAIGSGGLIGQGWLAGTQSQLHFLPESHTDFIFATFAEQWGWLGSIALLLLYYFLIRTGFQIASRTHDYFGRLMALGISVMLAIQVYINIAMNMGLAPVVGVPLPLMSYGGSSMAVTFVALGILASIDRERSVF